MTQHCSSVDAHPSFSRNVTMARRAGALCTSAKWSNAAAAGAPCPEAKALALVAALLSRSTAGLLRRTPTPCFVFCAGSCTAECLRFARTKVRCRRVRKCGLGGAGGRVQRAQVH
jgi:hypothetical protein